MKIFITGVAGFLGSHLADLMISQGHTVAGNDNMIGGYADNVPQGVEFHQVDCCDSNTEFSVYFEDNEFSHATDNNTDENYNIPDDLIELLAELTESVTE